jgi:hypothetical protein
MAQWMNESGGTTPHAQRPTLARYLCDWPGCDNVAEHVLGVKRDLGLFAAICREHAGLQRARSRRARSGKRSGAQV